MTVDYRTLLEDAMYHDGLGGGEVDAVLTAPVSELCEDCENGMVPCCEAEADKVTLGPIRGAEYFWKNCTHPNPPTIYDLLLVGEVFIDRIHDFINPSHGIRGSDGELLIKTDDEILIVVDRKKWHGLLAAIEKNRQKDMP